MYCMTNKKHTIEFVKQVFADNGCQLLEDVYVNYPRP